MKKLKIIIFTFLFLPSISLLGQDYYIDQIYTTLETCSGVIHEPQFPDMFISRQIEITSTSNSSSSIQLTFGSETYLEYFFDDFTFTGFGARMVIYDEDYTILYNSENNPNPNGLTITSTSGKLFIDYLSEQFDVGKFDLTISCESNIKIHKVDNVDPCNTKNFIGISGYSINNINNNVLPLKQEIITETDLDLLCPNNTLSTSSTESGYWREKGTNNTSLFTDNTSPTTDFLGDIEVPYSVEWITENNCIEKIYQTNVIISSSAVSKDWAINGGGTKSDRSSKISTDSEGNVYIVGTFSGSVTFGATTLTSNGNDDVYIIKYASDGTFIWAKNGGGTSNDRVGGISIDSDGNVYIAGGSLSTSVTFGATTLSSSGPFVFVVKYNSDGKAIWVKSGGVDKTYYDINDVAISNNILYIIGNEGSSSSGNGLLIKYDTDGVFISEKKSGIYQTFSNISIDNNQNTYIVTQKIQVESDPFGGPDQDIHDDFLVKYDSNGNVIWTKNINSSKGSIRSKISIDSEENVFLVKKFSSTITLIKYNSDGNIIWETSVSDGGTAFPEGISIDINGNVYVTGHFYGTVNFSSTILTSNGSYDVFLVKYNSDGNIIWETSGGGSNYEITNDIVTGVNGNVYVTGYFNETSTFGSTNLFSKGNDDIFVYKFNGEEEELNIESSCDNNSVTLSTKSTNAGSWKFANGSETDGTFSSETNPSATFTGTLGKTYELEWITNGVGCDQQKFTTNVTLKQKTQSIITETDLALLCPNNTLSTSSTKNGYWREQGTNNTSLFTDNTNPTTTFLGDLNTQYAIEWVTENNCIEKLYQTNVTLSVPEVPSEGWAKHGDGSGNDGGNDVITDSDGNVYATGYFNGTITFGTTTLTSNGSSDVFVVKYDPNGNVLWAKHGGGSGNDGGNSIIVDTEGNVYVLGSFSETAMFGTTTLTLDFGFLSVNYFLIKYDANGNVLWAKKGNADQEFEEMSIFNNNIYITITETGRSSILKFDGDGNKSTILSSNSIPSSGFAIDNIGNFYTIEDRMADFFPQSHLIKYDSDGNQIWIKTTSGIDITTDNEGYIYTSSSSRISKYDSDGNQIWIKTTSGITNKKIVTDSQGDVYVTGYFFGTTTVGSTTITSKGSNDAFTVKYDGDGDVIWVKTQGSNSSDASSGVNVDSDGNVYLTGLFNDTVTFGTTTLTSNGSSDVFVYKITTPPTNIESDCGNNSVTLSTQSTDAGSWKFANGSEIDGTFSSETNPSATFTGTLGKTYELEWITNGVSCEKKTFTTNVVLKSICD